MCGTQRTSLALPSCLTHACAAFVAERSVKKRKSSVAAVRGESLPHVLSDSSTTPARRPLDTRSLDPFPHWTKAFGCLHCPSTDDAHPFFRRRMTRTRASFAVSQVFILLTVGGGSVETPTLSSNSPSALEGIYLDDDSLEMISQLFKKLDRTSDGKLSADDFAAFSAWELQKNSEKWIQLRAKFDSDADGSITLQEFRQGFKTWALTTAALMGELPPLLTDLNSWLDEVCSYLPHHRHPPGGIPFANCGLICLPCV